MSAADRAVFLHHAGSDFPAEWQGMQEEGMAIKLLISIVRKL